MINNSMNNIVALQTLNQLDRNSWQLRKDMRNISSGMRINGAGDDASAYNISEKMRTKIRGLSQCGNNAAMGKSVMQIAEGAVDNQIQLLKKVREIAMKASDGTYTQADRDALQSETNQLLMEVNKISYETNYNGKQLLNGLTEGKTVTTFDSGAAMTNNTINNLVPVPNSVSSGTTPSYNGYGPDTYQYISGTVYDPNNIVWTAGTSFSGVRTGGSVYDSAGTAYTVSVDPVTNAFMANGMLIVDASGNDSNNNTVAAGAGFTMYDGQYAAIAAPTIGQAITTTQNYNPSSSPTTGTYGVEEFSGRSIMYGTGSYSSYKVDLTGATNAGGSPLSLPNDLDGQGFSIMCDACNQFVSIKFDAGMPQGTGQHHVNASDSSEAYIIGIQGAATEADVGAALFNGIAQANGTPTGTNPVTITDRHTVAINSYTDPVSGTTSYDITKNGPKFCFYNGFKGSINTIGGNLPYDNFPIQGDTRGSAYTNFKLPNTTLDTLFPADNSVLDIEPEETDYPDPWPNSYAELTDDEKKAKWRDEVWPYPKKGALASGSCVVTQEKAAKFLDDVDQALKYLLNTNTLLGSQQQRLEYMAQNITTMHENVTDSESVIRDADMAKEVTSYQKSNVLQQSAQSMLSHAQQSTGSILDLLK